MAESLAEKLKRLAREKKEAAAKAAEVNVVASNADDQPKEVEEVKDGKDDLSELQTASGQATPEGCVDSSPAEGDRQIVQESVYVESELDIAVTGGSSGIVGTKDLTDGLQPTPSDHPLAMQFAELESALLTTDPRFKTILRDVHRHLGQDPDLVTLMTEGEVAMIVRGLVTFANAEIVAPAKTKALKSASRKAISADDL